MKYPLYICSNSDEGHGLHLSWLDCQAGELSQPEPVVELTAANYLEIDQRHQRLFCSSVAGDGDPTRVYSFNIDPLSGALEPINAKSLDVQSWMYLKLDTEARTLFAVDFFAGDIVTYPIDSQGRIGEVATRLINEGSSIHKLRQTQTHPHAIGPDPLNRIVVVPDRGSDDVYLYRYDPKTSELAPHAKRSLKFRLGSGPRHFAWHPNNRWLYIINEMGSTVTAIEVDAGADNLDVLQYIDTLPDDCSLENATSEVAVSDDGRFLYGANRGHDSIVGYSIDQESGKLSLLGHYPTGGKASRFFAIDPSGGFLIVANTDSHTLAVFKRDQVSGALHFTGQTVEMNRCPCIKFLDTK